MAGEGYFNSILMGLPPGWERNTQFAQPGPYTTTLSPDVNQQFMDWVKANHVPITPDYNMQGLFQALLAGTAHTGIDPWDKRLHYPDTFKRPSAPTFSRESNYAKKDAPYWVDDKRLLDPQGKLIYEDK
jgi:hypothetical protein